MKKYAIALSIVFTMFTAACGTSDTPEQNHETIAPPPESSQVVTPALLLRTVEDIGAELELRQASGALSAEWDEVWSQAQVVRQRSELQNLLALIDQRASSGELLAVGSEVIELYFESYEPTFRLMEKQHSSGTLDARLTELRSNWLSVAERVDQSTDSSQRAATWCCRGTLSFSEKWHCNEFKTAGIWAATKCAAIFAHIPIVDGFRLSKQSCSDVAECQ
ncbi:hypothetical protein F0U60_00520 [Archangium minus]|uniref:Lipoprotein n=1 Tax=Archangium minus TaxID=83450 RepID=A0ABY9WHI7_9BACT|nr:hypothetical protein F0U60_00520 [Archangium minus]